MTEPRVQRITPEARASGADLHVEGFVQHLLVDVLAVLAEKPVLVEDLLALVDNPPTPPDPYQPERHMPTESLVERLMAALPDASKAIRVHGPQLDVLAGGLVAIVKQQGSRPIGAVPQPRDGKAA